MPWQIEGDCPAETRKRLEALLAQVDLKERLLAVLWEQIHLSAVEYRLSVRRLP